MHVACTAILIQSRVFPSFNQNNEMNYLNLKYIIRFDSMIWPEFPVGNCQAILTHGAPEAQPSKRILDNL